MHQNGAMVLHLQCHMNSESISAQGTLPHMPNHFGLPDLILYGLILNIHATIQ